MSYTPGPWKWYGDFLRGPGGEVKFCRECGSVYRNSGSIGADASLIAAAPLMLEALIDLLPVAYASIENADEYFVIKQALAAIAQAKGQL